MMLMTMMISRKPNVNTIIYKKGVFIYSISLPLLQVIIREMVLLVKWRGYWSHHQTMPARKQTWTPLLLPEKFFYLFIFFIYLYFIFLAQFGGISRCPIYRQRNIVSSLRLCIQSLKYLQCVWRIFQWLDAVQTIDTSFIYIFNLNKP